MLVGQKIGPFKVEKELGSGAMGTVYRATNMETGQRVAIKMVSPALGTSEQSMNRFKREASILKQLDHPNIVKYMASGRVSGTPFYAMEYVEGESLDQVMERRGRLSWEEVVTIGQQLCAGLQHAHEKGIVHRDLKPSNLMVLPDGTVKLTDFGIAKDLDVTALTAANSTVGTASYMSPEQCRGDRDISSKSDLYSMGVMFYELLTGRKPFNAESVMDMFNKHCSATFERPSRLKPEIPIWFDTLVCHLMEKKPDKRPYDANTVAKALEQVKQKVVAQSSAGLEAAKRRKIDKTDLMPALDEEDKEAARTLLHKKKKKTKLGPIYQRLWFQALLLSGVLAAVAYVIYAAFLKTPDAEGLYRQADALMKSSKTDDWKEARRGPIADFLRYHPAHEKVKQIEDWADKADLAQLETQMHNRRLGKWKVEDESEKLARQALDEEDTGNLEDARKLWSRLQSINKDKKREDEGRAWRLVAEKYVRGLQDVDRLHKELQDKINIEWSTKKPAVADSTREKQGLQALRFEAEEQRDKAKSEWESLKKNAETEDQRTWFLLAAKQLVELKKVTPTP